MAALALTCRQIHTSCCLHAVVADNNPCDELMQLNVLCLSRQELMSGSQQRQTGKETEVTAELDNKGLVQLQQQIIHQQDRELEQMEKTVVSTKVSRNRCKMCCAAAYQSDHQCMRCPALQLCCASRVLHASAE